MNLRQIIISTSLAVASAGLLAAEEAKPVKYTATMSGVVCSACKKTVRDSFTKMGASKVEIKAGAKSGEQTVTFESVNAKLTKEAAIKALGDSAEEFKVLSLAAVK
ncbi:MAG: hypothetical protein ACKV19_13655 [Verrucomicrobiales bacterium]